MAEHDPAPEDPRCAELNDVLDTQRRLITELCETIGRQATLISELQEDLRGGRGWKPKGRSKHTGAAYEGLGVRTEAILRLAEAEAANLRDEARQDAAARIAAAELEVARIRSEVSGSGEAEA